MKKDRKRLPYIAANALINKVGKHVFRVFPGLCDRNVVQVTPHVSQQQGLPYAVKQVVSYVLPH